jgi:hypothetical protein
MVVNKNVGLALAFLGFCSDFTSAKMSVLIFRRHAMLPLKRLAVVTTEMRMATPADVDEVFGD